LAGVQLAWSNIKRFENPINSPRGRICTEIGN
jgi:hypothetical protein